ncbi:LysR family transcriptional regulator [Erwinia sp. SLM-02]|uniref:LysR family transcriptional regulator n=1 Tax=Erwinia sp. SLM-02 TaxID=3020057 RepID=UPI0028D78149|nr:LysR family transcriptional regulator [uncultured Erwinia sp.]
MAINFSLAQIEAFACVVESGSITHAAKRMNKDRTTVSELLDYLELDLGYALFDRHCRPFALTERGSLLYRRARLFLNEAQAFSYLAMQQQKQPPQTLTLSYDIFTPRALLATLAEECRQQGVQLNLCYQDRQDAEQALQKSEIDIGIYQAVNKSVSERFKWRAVGSIEMGVYASPALFEHRPVSQLSLAACNQLIPNKALEEHLARRLQIADRVQFVNDAMLLESLLEKGAGWAFLPVHVMAGRQSQIERIETEMGSSGIVHTMVAIWQPGQAGHPILNQVLDRITELFAAN